MDWRGSSVQEVTGCSRGSSRGSLPVPIPPASGQELARAKRKLLFRSNVFQGNNYKAPDHAPVGSQEVMLWLSDFPPQTGWVVNSGASWIGQSNVVISWCVQQLPATLQVQEFFITMGGTLNREQMSCLCLQFSVALCLTEHY